MMFSYFCLLVTFIAVLSDAQSFTYLKDLKANNAVNIVYGKSAPSSVYFTGSSDDKNLLKQIIFTSGDNKTSVYDLTQRRVLSGYDSILGWPVSGITTMQTTLSSDDLMSLTGGVYFTTTNQAQNKYFHVYDVSQMQQVTLDEGDHTLVFLNSINTNYPKTPTSIKSWNQPSAKTAYIYNGIPSDGIENENTQIFSNPITANGQSVFFDSVEDFSITTSPFYMKVSGVGPKYMTFMTSPYYFNVDDSHTKAYTTTGFFMKSSSELPKTVSIYPRKDSGLASFTGANSIAIIPTSGKILVTSYQDSTPTAHIFNRSDKIYSWYIPEVGTKLEISSEQSEAGQFYIQYYFIKGTSIVGTTSSPTGQSTQSPYHPKTTRHSSGVETSTKSVGKTEIGYLIVFSLVFLLL